MVARNDIYWADLGPPAGRRPICVLTRRGDRRAPLSQLCTRHTDNVISCDSIITIPLEDLDDRPVGHLDEITRARLDQALRYALDIVY